MVGPCSLCGPFSQYCTHQSGGAASSYWPMQNQQQTQYPYYNNNSSSYDEYDETDYMYSSSSSSSPYSSVDCTLSLGNPSTRLSNDNSSKSNTTTPHRNSVSSFCWDLLHSKQSSGSSTKSSRSSNHGGGGGGDPLFVRRCANCDTTSTPLWRNGPRGPKSLCNACGIRFKKEERRAAAATTTAAANNVAAGGMVDPHSGYYNGSWSHQYSQGTSQKMQYYGTQNEFRFTEDDNGSDSSIQFLSWLTHDRPSGLVHDFTR